LARFRIRRQPDRFQGNDITIFLNDEIVSSRVDDSHMGFERRRKPSKWQFGSKISLGNVIASRNHHKKDLMMVIRLRVGASLLESPIANSYAQSNNITSEQGTPNNNVNSDLTASSNQ
jgi:hypothetical protein